MVELYLKSENHQKSGPFKFRGALHKLLSHHDDTLKKGVVTYSTGKYLRHHECIQVSVRRGHADISQGHHGLAMLLATQQLSETKGFDIPLQIVTKKSCSSDKVERLKARCASLDFQGTQEKEVCKQRAPELAGRSGGTLVLPSGEAIILGAGLVCLEILEQVPDVDAVIVLCGSGSLLAGASVVCQSTNTDLIATETEQGGSQLSEGLKTNQRLGQDSSGPTLAHGLRTSMGETSWRVISQEGLVNGSFMVSESQIVEALKGYHSNHPDVLEPSGVASLAGALFCSSSFVDSKPKGSTIKVAIVLTGAKVSKSTIDKIVKHNPD